MARAIFVLLLLFFHQAFAIEPLRIISPIDNPEIMNPKMPLERNLLALDSKTAWHASLNLKPWADGSWKLDSGLIAARYADEGFVRESRVSGRLEYMSDRPASRVFAEPDRNKRAQLIDQLSPAEKYDLLVGDTNYTLTRALWGETDKYNSAHDLANWMGICEGSAAAGTLYPEPLHAVDFTTAAGDPIRFHILDIKGLAALLWSSYNVHTTYSGSRCGTRFPRKSNEACFNSNPGSFHIALLNYIGLHRKPFFINRTPKLEVWNVPILSYDIRYFDVRNKSHTSSLREAMAPIDTLKKDHFKNFRSPRTAYVVGVKTDITVAKGTTSRRDIATPSATAVLSYTYDLELDNRGVIIGGEWDGSFHPDFMWAVEDNFRPLTVGDKQLGEIEWTDGRIPSEWLSAIRQSSARNQPLEKIVRRLVELSR